MTWATDPNEHRLCLALLDAPDHAHRCGAPFGHGGPEHCCQVCGGWVPVRRWGGDGVSGVSREQAAALESLRAGLLRSAAEQRRRGDRRRWEAKAEGVALALGHLDALDRHAAADDLTRHMPSAVREGGTERSGDVQRPDGPTESAGPSDGRTGPLPAAEIVVAADGTTSRIPLEVPQRQVRGWITFERPDPALCGEANGDMRCQLRRGHAGGHEDYRGVAQERRG